MPTRHPRRCEERSNPGHKPYPRPFQLALLALLTTAATDPLVPYQTDGDTIPRPLTTQPGDPTSGRALLLARERSTCLLCHAGPFPEPRLQGTIGPTLAGVADRLTPAQLRLRLVNEAAINPGTLMPSFYSTSGLTRVAPQYQGRPILTAAEIEDLVAYLSTLHAP